MFCFREWSNFKFYLNCVKTILLLFLLKIAYGGSPNYLSVLTLSVVVEIIIRKEVVWSGTKTAYGADAFPGPACIPWRALISTLILIKMVIFNLQFFHANKSDYSFMLLIFVFFLRSIKLFAFSFYNSTSVIVEDVTKAKRFWGLFGSSMPSTSTSAWSWVFRETHPRHRGRHLCSSRASMMEFNTLETRHNPIILWHIYPMATKIFKAPFWLWKIPSSFSWLAVPFINNCVILCWDLWWM